MMARGGRDAGRSPGTPRIIRKIVLTAATGGVAYLLTNTTTDESLVLSLMLSAFIGGVTLVIQFMIDFENRLKTATELYGVVEESALRTDELIQLIQLTNLINSESPTLVRRFVQGETDRLTDLLKKLGEGADVIYEGEDRDWLLGLARTSQHSIDAVSFSREDPRGRVFVDEGLWENDLGQRYLETQRDAMKRGVVIRRLFIPDRPELAHDPALLKIYRLQREAGISVRILDPSAVPVHYRTQLVDFIVFDATISYETTTPWRMPDTDGTVIPNTRLIQRPNLVAERIQGFEALWASAHELETV